MSHAHVPSPAQRERTRPSRWLRLPSGVSDVLALLSGVLILGLMFLTVADVTLRKFFSSGVPGAVEINEVALVAVVFLALMAAEITDTNVRTPLLTERLPSRWANLAHIVGYVPAVGFLVWATYVTGVEGIASWLRGDFRFGLIFVPTWPGKLIVPIGLAGLSIAVAIKLVQAVVAFVKSRPAVIADHESVL
jgi:TRAP-type C4-dicarboxylate transport system permease small subunit